MGRGPRKAVPPGPSERAFCWFSACELQRVEAPPPTTQAEAQPGRSRSQGRLFRGTLLTSGRFAVNGVRG